jgi:solute carrier family 35 protein F1/2
VSDFRSFALANPHKAPTSHPIASAIFVQYPTIAQISSRNLDVTMSSFKETGTAVRATSVDLGRNYGAASGSSRAPIEHGHPEVVESIPERSLDKKKTWREKVAYFRTKDFWFILLLGQILALCITGTNTLSTLLVIEGTSIPAFQTLFNYVLLNIIYTGYTLYKYGFKKWGKMVLRDGWKYIILAFFDVEGNYFTVLAYRYTTILSAQLINFWAIVVVVVISFLFLRVRYHWAQVLGIIVCIGGVGILIGSDHITGATSGSVSSGNQLKGDLFCLLGATFYGLANVYEEWFVSGRPLYEVIGQLAFWAMIINGVQAGIFDRDSFHTANWNGKVGGYLVGYTLILTIFYTGVPVLYRFASAAFQNISLLTGNFWGVIIGIRVFGYSVHWMYPIAFTLIMVGHFVYYLGKGVLGEAAKPWLGANQELGIDGFGSAKRKIGQMQASAAGTRGGEGVEGAGVV